jgi:hypothetical protein
MPAVSHCLLAAEAKVRCQGTPCGVQSGTGMCFSPSRLVSPVDVIPPQLHIHPGTDGGVPPPPRTQSHPIFTLKRKDSKYVERFAYRGVGYLVTLSFRLLIYIRFLAACAADDLRSHQLTQTRGRSGTFYRLYPQEAPIYGFRARPVTFLPSERNVNSFSNRLQPSHSIISL